MKNYKNLILILFTIILTTYFSLNYIVGKHKLITLKNLLSSEQKYLIKKYIFPYKVIPKQEKIISQQEKIISNLFDQFNFNELELTFKKSLKNIETKKTSETLTNNLLLKKYNLIGGFYKGIQSVFPGSGYIHFHQNNLLILSSRGVLGFTKDINNELNFKQIKNNINEFIGLEQFNKHKSFSLKDLFLHNSKIYISYTEEIKEDCWNTSVIYGDINYKNIQFKKLFSSKECIHSSNNIDNEFNPSQSGGRIVNFDENHILLSVGDYRSRYLAQNKESINGKIIKINTNNSNYEIISMGHRNPQGLYLDKENNFILETEHGPVGGDEINLIKINQLGNNEIPNYGWAIASAGEHYSRSDGKKYKKYPLYKSHSEYGFIEPLKSFVPSIGISEITKIEQNKYVVSSLRDNSLYFFQLNNEKEIINLERVEVFERVRDLIFKDGKLYLFLEDTASIGVISII